MTPETVRFDLNKCRRQWDDAEERRTIAQALAKKQFTQEQIADALGVTERQQFDETWPTGQMSGQRPTPNDPPSASVAARPTPFHPLLTKMAHRRPAC